MFQFSSLAETPDLESKRERRRRRRRREEEEEQEQQYLSAYGNDDSYSNEDFRRGSPLCKWWLSCLLFYHR